MLRCSGEDIEKTSRVGRARGQRSSVSDVLTRAGHHLSRVGLFEPKDVRDLAVWIVEGFSKDEGGSFGGGQPFEQQLNAKRDGLTLLRSPLMICAGVDWLG
jgi:hypothetical protein